MTFKTSLYEKGLITSDFRRFWWISVLYTLALFFLLPFNHLMQIASLKDEWRKAMLSESLRLSINQNQFQVLLICIVPVALAVLLFRYMQAPRSAAMMHSLPFRRRTLFASHCTAGFALLTVPVILTGLVLMLLQVFTPLQEIYSLPDILQWIGVTLLFDLLFFAFAVFVGMFTGNSIAQFVFTYILHLLPAGFYMLLNYNLRHLIFGYNADDSFGDFSRNLPMLALLNSRFEPWQPFTANVIGYLLTTVILFAAAGFIYEARKLEAAGDIVSFPAIRPLFKYGVAFCCMLLGSVYFSNISNGSTPVIFLGYAVTSFIGYWVAEMLIQKSFHVWHAFKGYLAFAAVSALILTGIATDITGFVHRVPDPAEVQKVYFGYNLDEWVHIEKMKDSKYLESKYGNKSMYEGSYFLESPDNIKRLTQLHRQLIQKPYGKQGSMRYIVYTLKNNRYLIRQYSIDEKQYSVFLKPVYESEEYKYALYPVMRQTPEQIKWIELNDSHTPKKPVVLASSNEILEFTKLLKSDIYHSHYEDMISNKRNYINIRMMNINEKQHQFELRSSYAAALQWLKEKGYYDKIALIPSDVESVTLEKFNKANRGAYGRNDSQPSSPKQIELKDRKIIEELVNIYFTQEYQPTQETVLVIFSITSNAGYYQVR